MPRPLLLILILTTLAFLFGVSPGVTLLIVALSVIALDAHDPRLIDSLTSAFADD